MKEWSLRDKKKSEPNDCPRLLQVEFPGHVTGKGALTGLNILLGEEAEHRSAKRQSLEVQKGQGSSNSQGKWTENGTQSFRDLQTVPLKFSDEYPSTHACEEVTQGLGKKCLKI